MGYNFNLEIEISPKLTYSGEGLHEILQQIDTNKIKEKTQFYLNFDNKELRIIRNYSDHYEIKQNIKAKNLSYHLTNSE